MQKKISIILVTIVFGAMLVFANSKGFLDGAKTTVGVVFSPVGTFFTGMGGNVSVFGGNLLNLGRLQSENANLVQQNNQLKAEIALLKEVENENNSLRKEVEFIERTRFSYEMAEVTGYDPSSLRGMISINKGSADGLKVGMAATSEGYLIGRISETTEHSAKVQLITDPTSAIPVSIQETNVNGIAKGELGSGLTMEKIPQGEEVKTGQVIVSSGLGGEIPKGIIIGEIEGISSQENSLFVSAKIRVSRNIQNVLRVLIVKGS
jgi:rod shape-determining protein MreC